MQGLFTGRVGTGNQLGIAGFGAGCIFGECLHGNTTQFCVCVSARSILLLHRLIHVMYPTSYIAKTTVYKVEYIKYATCIALDILPPWGKYRPLLMDPLQ